MKRTIYIGNPSYLAYRQGRLQLTRPDDPVFEKLVPVEDIGMLVLDHQQVTITQALQQALLAQEAAVVVCDESHMPAGLLLPMTGHTLHQVRLRNQVQASVPLQKQLWRQTIIAKLRNQASVLRHLGCHSEPIEYWATKVRSGDPDNLEGRAAAHYWEQLLHTAYGVRRDPEGDFPNALFNYAYAILRAITARALVSAGLHPALGLFHRNQYNAFALADDIMEPYRPYADQLVLAALENRTEEGPFLSLSDKRWLLNVPVIGVPLATDQVPLTYALTRTCASLAQAFAAETRALVWPNGIGSLDAIAV